MIINIRCWFLKIFYKSKIISIILNDNKTFNKGDVIVYHNSKLKFMNIGKNKYIVL